MMTPTHEYPNATTADLRFLPTALAAAMCLCAACATAQPDKGHGRLYTNPDPSCEGGIRGSVTGITGPIEQILAVPPDEPRLVYRGEVSGENRHAFEFQNLPMRKYDLILIGKNTFYEGLRLHRDDDTLTQEDRRKIEDIVQKSEPFFTKKVIHRLEGTTGRGNFSRCICTFLRDLSSDTGGGFITSQYRRTFKIMVLKDVGPGWQVVRSRDLYPTYVDPGKGFLPHHYSEALTGIRVTNYVKDTGEINLTKP